MNFEKFGLDRRVFLGIQALGYKAPTPIQDQAIPLILQGHDIVGLAQTGTGKTAAFILPVLHQLLAGPRGRLRALIIVPTRELAEQIQETIRQLGRETELRSTTLYGGVSLLKQCQSLRRGIDVIVACPGRLLDHIHRGNIDFADLKVLVLDEADQMFDFGFFPTLRKILQFLPKKQQRLFFSATMPKAVQGLVNELLHNPIPIQIGQLDPVSTVEQKFYPVTEALKTELLIKLLQINAMESVLIFTRTKRRAKQLAEHLEAIGHSATSFQGNLSQGKRQMALERFRNKKLKILVATDIAARGIDITHVSHVINFDMPGTTEAYTHRIGRTGRATKLGAAFTLITPSDGRQMRSMERQFKQILQKCIIPEFNYHAVPNTSMALSKAHDNHSSRQQQILVARTYNTSRQINLHNNNTHQKNSTRHGSHSGHFQKSNTKPLRTTFNDNR